MINTVTFCLQESRDKCQWYAAKAYKENPGETQNRCTNLQNQTGRVSELDPGKGVIIFDFQNQVRSVKS